MRFRLLSAFIPALLAAAPALEVVKPDIALSVGGPPDPAGFTHVAGETLFFTCRVANFTKSADEKIHLAYSVEAFDPQGVPLNEIYKNEIADEVTPQDREWQPKIETEIDTPPLVPSGAYKIVVKVEDLIAKTSAELSVPFQVHGHALEPSDTLVVRNFQYFRGEDDVRPLEKAVYHPGDAVFDSTARLNAARRGAERRPGYPPPEPAAEAANRRATSRAIVWLESIGS